MIVPRFVAMAFAVALIAVTGLRPDTLAGLGAATAALPSDDAVWQGLLAALLFAAAVRLKPKGPVRVATSVTMLGLILSTLAILIVAWSARWLFGRLGLEIDFAYCLLFAAAATPADPIAVLRSLRLAGGGAGLAQRATGEALLANLAGIVVFAVVITRLEPAGAFQGLPALLAQQAGGAILLGICLGLAALVLLRLHAHPAVVAAASFAVVGGAWWLGEVLPLSGPVAAAVAGFVIASVRHDESEGADPRSALPAVWSVVAEVVTVVLIVALALALVASPATLHFYGAGVFLVPIAVLARALIVFPALWAFARAWQLPDELARTVTWGGVRGGLLAALVLSLPAGLEATMLQAAAFVLLLFSLLLQAPVYGFLLASRRPLAES